MLSVDNLTRRFGAHTVLDGFSLDVPAGSVACLVGPSGCGKSTLLRLVAGLDRPDSGEIRVRDTVISAPGWALEPHKRRLNMVFQDYALWPHMKVRRIVGYGLDRLPAAEREARVSALLDQLQIGALGDRLPSQISGGQQQRVAIARALATDPDILLLDEPLSNLDVQLRVEMRKEFSTLFRSVGKTVLYVTHDPLEAASFADILVVMNRGAIEQMGSPEALFAAPQSAWIATLAGYETRMEGEITGEAGADGWTVSIGGQPVRVPKTPDGASPRDGRVLVMLHPAHVALGASAGANGNHLTGTVAHALFEGHGWRVVLDIGGQSLSMLRETRMAVGESVTIGFPPESAVVFPYA